MILALTLSLAALDAGIGVPPWPLSPDGERVAVFVDAPLQAEGARVEHEAGSPLWLVFPDAGREMVHLRAGGGSLDARVGPQPGRILVTLDPAEPVKGRDRAARLRLEVRSVAGEPLALESPPSVVVSVGKLGPFAPSALPGRYEASWTPSDSPQPEVLGVVAIAPRCPACATPLASGVARFPIAAAIDLPGKSEPGVETRVEIAGRVWGPVRADKDGRVTVPAIVPPGARWAFATSLNSLGNERRAKLDLGLSETPGFQCAIWPERVPADGRTEAGVLCVPWTPDGGRLDPRSLRASVVRGAITGERFDGDAWSARYRPPVGGAGSDTISIDWTPVRAARAELSVGLASGAPVAIEWAPDEEPAIPGSTIRITARALDVQGDRLGDATAADGSIGGGYLQVRRELGDGQQQLTLTHALPPGSAPANLSLHRVGDEWVAVARDVDARAVAGVAVRFGDGQRGVTDARGEAHSRARGPVETVEGPLGLRAIGWAAAPTPIPRLSVTRGVRLALRPPGAVDVSAALEGRWIRWTVRAADGALLADRAVTAESGTVDLGPVEVEGVAGRCAVRGGKGTVAVTDAESGSTALLVVK